MTRMRILVVGWLLAATATANAALPAEINGQPVASLAPIVESASPAVVNIAVRQTVSSRQPYADDAFRRFFGIPDQGGRSRQVASATVFDDVRDYIALWREASPFSYGSST